MSEPACPNGLSLLGVADEDDLTTGASSHSAEDDVCFGRWKLGELVADDDRAGREQGLKGEAGDRRGFEAGLAKLADVLVRG